MSADPWVPRGVSREHTFQRDLATREEIERELHRIALDTAEDVRKDGRDVVRVVVKVRVVPFITKTRGVALGAPTVDPEEIAAAALAALDRFPPIERPVRLLGVRAEFVRDEESASEDPGGGQLSVAD